MNSVFFTFVYAGANCFLGLSLIKLLTPKFLYEKSFHWYAVVASGFLLGQGILANIWLLLGLGSFFKSYIIWAIIIIIYIFGSFIIRGFYNPIICKIQGTIKQIMGLSTLWRVIFILLVISIFLYGLASIIEPPKGDAEAFYMVLPKIMAASEQLRPQPNYYGFTQIGLFGEMHYAALMSIGNPAAAKFFVWFTALSLAILLLSLCAGVGLQFKGQIIALIILFTSTAFTKIIADGKVDLFGGALGIAAYYWAFHTGKKNFRLPYILTGLFSGFAIIAKFSNIPVLLSGILIIFIWNHWSLFKLKEADRFALMKRLGFMIILASISFILSIIPHLIKNGVLFNEPLAPFFFLKGNGDYWLDQAWYSPENTRYILLTYPIALIFGKYPMQIGNLSAFVLIFLPLLVLKKKSSVFEQKKLLQITMIALIGVITWMVVRPAVIAPRYILATLLLFIPIAAWAAENLILLDGYKLLKRTVYFSLFLSLLGLLARTGDVPGEFVKYAGSGFKEGVLKTSYYDSLNYVNKIAAQGDRVFLGGYYAYNLRPDLLQCMNGPNDESWSSFNTSEKRWEYLFNRGFKFLVIQKKSHGSMVESFNLNNVPAWLKVEEVYQDTKNVVYSLSSISLAHRPQIGTRQHPFPAWEVYQLSDH